MMQERPPSRSRNPTARTKPARSPYIARTAFGPSTPSFSLATRNIAARDSLAATA